jgi:topoisomerase-4 subunit A
VPLEAVVEREPITVLLSQKGWIRAMKGHHEDVSDAKYKEGDRGRFALKAQTTDKLLLLGTNGRIYTLGADKLPGGRGFGEPVRLLLDLPNDQDVVQVLVHSAGRRLLIASNDGRGFLVPEDEVLAQTRNGKQVLNLAEGAEAAVCRPASPEDDHVAVIGENRKLLVFERAELPEMSRGRGVMLQRYRDGGLSDAKTFNLAEGLAWSMGPGGRVRSETDLTAWIGKRAAAGRLPPNGFPRSNRFGEV